VVGLFISDGRLNLPLMAKDGLNRRIPPMQSRLLRKPEVLFRTGLKKSQLDIAIKDGRFPASFPILEGGRLKPGLRTKSTPTSNPAVKHVMRRLACRPLRSGWPGENFTTS
jgi:predicted DNA-binding transcriptional regulator AlpA